MRPALRSQYCPHRQNCNECQLRAIATDVVTQRGLCAQRCLPVCVGHASMLCKTAERTEMPFWMKTSVGARKLSAAHVVVTQRIQRNNLFGSGRAGCRYHYCDDLLCKTQGQGTIYYYNAFTQKKMQQGNLLHRKVRLSTVTGLWS